MDRRVKIASFSRLKEPERLLAVAHQHVLGLLSFVDLTATSARMSRPCRAPINQHQLGRNDLGVVVAAGERVPIVVSHGD